MSACIAQQSGGELEKPEISLVLTQAVQEIEDPLLVSRWLGIKFSVIPA